MTSKLIKLVSIGIFLLQLANFSLCFTVSFQLYTQQNPTTYEQVNNLANSVYYIKNAETKFLVHGFGDNGQITYLNRVKEELLKKENINVIIVDWRDGASMPNYLNAAKNTKTTAQYVVDFINLNNLNPLKIHCIGHSLGGHICGFIGKSKKLRRISGLDPAGPLFKGNNPADRLDKNDAYLVDNIHTSGFYGIQESSGHKDFYPNGGKNQPGCGLEYFNFDFNINFPNIGNIFDISLPNIFNFSFPNIFGKRYLEELHGLSNENKRGIDPGLIVACSHLRVALLYAESIKQTCFFNAIPCADYDKYKANKCSCTSTNGCPLMGYYADKNPEEGNFFLETTRDVPYCNTNYF